jgi:hypothetical protein
MGLIIKPDAVQPRDLATSTIALSIYNVLVAIGREQTMTQIYQTICVGHNMEIPKDQFVEAMDGLCKRAFLAIHMKDDENPTERFSPADKIRRHVRWRDRTGDGWNNWSVQGEQGGIRRLEEVIHV